MSDQILDYAPPKRPAHLLARDYATATLSGIVMFALAFFPLSIWAHDHWHVAPPSLLEIGIVLLSSGAGVASFWATLKHYRRVRKPAAVGGS